MNLSWIDLLGAGFGGGLAVKLLDYVYNEYIRRSKESRSARDLLNKNLDPILKAADELVGKLRSMAQADFHNTAQPPAIDEKNFQKWFPMLDVLYLFAHFWARIQILRYEGLYANIGNDRRGKKLLSFIRTLESSRMQFIGRAWQRGMGEIILLRTENEFRALTFVEFSEKFLTVAECRRWFEPLLAVIAKLHHTGQRQKLLRYGTVIHALIDTLDEKHLVTGDKPGWANKLSKRTRRELQYRIFKVYLSFVPNAQKYWSAEEKQAA